MYKALFKVSLIFIVLCVGASIVDLIEPTKAGYSTFIDQYIRSKGIWGVLMYIGLVSVISCFAIPRQLLAFVGGYAYGAFWGALFITIGVTFSCVFTFYFARFVAQKTVQAKLGKAIEKLELFLNREPMTMAIVIRLLPIGSNLVTNMVAGMTKIRSLPFFMGSAIGYIPQNFIFSLLGSGIELDNNINIIISGLLFIAAIILGIYLYKKHKVEEMENIIDG